MGDVKPLLSGSGAILFKYSETEHAIFDEVRSRRGDWEPWARTAVSSRDDIGKRALWPDEESISCVRTGEVNGGEMKSFSRSR